MKLQDMKQTDGVAGHEIAGHENTGHENARRENAGHENAQAFGRISVSRFHRLDSYLPTVGAC